MTEPSHPYTTKSGRALTEAELDALADEAERGYDIAALARRPGRPRLGSAPAVVVPVRLHAELHAAVKAQAAATTTSVSDLVRQALAAYLASEPPVIGSERTRSGQLLSTAETDALAAAAETGYDPAVLRPRPGRNRARAEVVPVRLPPEAKAALERRAEIESTSSSEIIRSALRAHLRQTEPMGTGMSHLHHRS
jgi:predicted transcriptional regulator